MRPHPFVISTVLVLALVGATVEIPDETAGPPPEQAIEAALDHLHQVRPTAATASPIDAPPAPTSSSGAPPLDPALLEPSLAVPATMVPPPGDVTGPGAVDAATPATAVTTPAPIAPPETSATAALACIRNRESRGVYTVVSANGLYYGAYQFLRSTWDNTAAHVGRDDLVGIPPNEVAPDDQDTLAIALLEWQGIAPWRGTGCRW